MRRIGGGWRTPPATAAVDVGTSVAALSTGVFFQDVDNPLADQIDGGPVSLTGDELSQPVQSTLGDWLAPGGPLPSPGQSVTVSVSGVPAVPGLPTDVNSALSVTYHLACTMPGCR